MLRQDAGLREGFITHVTGVGSFPGVAAAMAVEKAGSGETFTAVLTLVWFLTGMHPLVHCQVV